MAKKGRPRKSPYKWNRERAEALQERIIERQAKVDSGEAEIKYPTSRERAEAAKEYRAGVMRTLAANVGLLKKLNGYQLKDAPLAALAEFINCPSREMAMELAEATNKPEKSLSAKVTEQDMDVFCNILKKHDVFASEPSNDEFRVIVRGKVLKPLRIKRIGLFVYFLDVAFEGQWQDIFAEAGMMRKSSGEPIRAKEWSRELSKTNEDRKILMQESMTYGFRVEQMRESKVERLRYYIEVDEALRAVTRG